MDKTGNAPVSPTSAAEDDALAGSPFPPHVIGVPCCALDAPHQFLPHSGGAAALHHARAQSPTGIGDCIHYIVRARSFNSEGLGARYSALTALTNSSPLSA